MDAAGADVYFSSMARTSQRRVITSFAKAPEVRAQDKLDGLADERNIYVDTVEARFGLNHQGIGPHRYPAIHQILVLEHGGVAASIDAYSGDFRAPGILIVPPGGVYSFRFRPKTTGILTLFSVPLARRLAFTVPAILDLLQEPSWLGIERSMLRATDIQSFSRLLLRQFSRSSTGRGLALYGLLSALLCTLLRLSKSETGGNVAMRQNEIVEGYRRLLESTYLQHVQISWYARRLGISETLLRRACHAVARESPVQMLHRRLALEATRQLRYTPMTVGQVAASLGFEDSAYFSRFFRRCKGVSPKAFREKLAL